MVLVYLINFRFGHYYLKYCFHFHYHLDHCRHHHLEDNLTKTILQWLRLSFRIHVDFLDKVVQLHYLRDYLDLVRLIVTEWMSKLQKHHMLDSIDFVRYLNRFLEKWIVMINDTYAQDILYRELQIDLIVKSN